MMLGLSGHLEGRPTLASSKSNPNFVSGIAMSDFRAWIIWLALWASGEPIGEASLSNIALFGGDCSRLGE